MKKTIFLVIIFVGLLLCAVGYADSHYRTALGQHVQPFALSNGSSEVLIGGANAKYRLVNFWNSADAPSRRQANDYTAWWRHHKQAPLDLVSVNFDRSEGMFREIVKLDSLDTGTQYHAAGKTAKALIDNFGLAEGYGSMLLDPSGKIVAHNPTDAQLSEIFATAE